MTTKQCRLRIVLWLVMVSQGLSVAAQGRPSSVAPVQHVLRDQQAAVVSVSEPASRVGRDILQRGGNAVDAAVATAVALSVTYPPAGNIGGGGFMMILPGPGRQPVCIDYRETAPRAATVTLFQLNASHLDPRMVGVPGTVRGLELAHRKYGRLPWHAVITPAVKMARNGFGVDTYLANSLNAILSDPRSVAYSELRRVYAPPVAGRWHPGDRLRQPDLAATLEGIAERGSDGFYAGPIAQAIAAEMRTGGGLITIEDLRDYRAKQRSPVHGTYRGYDVYGPPLPSSGGIALVEMLNILEPFHLAENGRWSPSSLHLMIEAMRRAYADRARYLGDEDFVSVPAKLTSKSYAAQLAASIDPR